jgi:hypothetical protein
MATATFNARAWASAIVAAAARLAASMVNTGFVIDVVMESVGFDVCRVDDLLEFDDLVFYCCGKHVRRVVHRIGCKRGQAVFDVGLLQRFGQFMAEPKSHPMGLQHAFECVIEAPSK